MITRIFFIAMILFSGIVTRAQQEAIDPHDSVFIKKYAGFNFKDKFAVPIGRYEVNNYFLLDFTKLKSRFEKVYFMNLCFTVNKLINIDPDIAKTRVCFMANKKYDENEIITQFDELIKQTSVINSTWSQDEKNKWLKANDKYK